MMYSNILGLILLLVISVSSLHTQQVYNQGYDIKAEILKLEAQQATFESNLERMIQNVESISNRAEQSNNTEKVLLIENSILRERQEIFSLSTQMLPPFNISKCSCENLTDKEKVLMLADLEGVKKNVDVVQESLRKVPRCQKTDALNKDVEKQLFFIQSMQDILYSKCLKVLNLSPTIFQTNLYVDNWILGDQTADEVVDEYYQRSLRYHNVTNCPISRPFFEGKQCISCDEPTPVFNLLQRKCISCGPGGVVDKTSKRCVNTKITYKNNYDVPNYSLEGLQGIPTPPANAIETCPITTPFFDGTKCISCPTPSYFSVLNGICKNCPSGQAFNANQKKCVQGQAVEPISVTAPVLTPVVQSSVQPEIGKFATNFDASNFIVPPNQQIQEFKSQQQQRVKNDTQIKICPIETPYSNGIKCLSCQRSPFLYFNLQTKKCTTCPANSTYNLEQKKCIATEVTTVQTPSVTKTQAQSSKPVPVTAVPLGDQFVSNLENNFWITTSGDVSKIFNDNRNRRATDPNVKICPIKTPFYNGQQCISCPSYFNFDTKQCQGCQSGKSFNPNLHICETASSSSDSYQTNPTKAPNLIYDGISYQQYKNSYEANVSNNPQIKDCEQQTPYWNGRQCIGCPSDKPYFNLDGKACQNCSPGSIYNPQSRQCQDNQGKYINQGPTIQKLIAGLI